METHTQNSISIFKGILLMQKGRFFFYPFKMEMSFESCASCTLGFCVHFFSLLLFLCCTQKESHCGHYWQFIYFLKDTQLLHQLLTFTLPSQVKGCMIFVVHANVCIGKKKTLKFLCFVHWTFSPCC